MLHNHLPHHPAPPPAAPGAGMAAQAGGRREVVLHAEVVVAERPSGFDAVMLAAVENLRRQNGCLHAELVAAERRPFELALIEPFLPEIAWLCDLARHLRWLQWDACQRAAQAAAVLLDPHASPAERDEARAILEEFVREDLRFDDRGIRSRFDSRELERLDPFVGLPLWKTVLGELRSGRWQNSTNDQPVGYLRTALVREAMRYYVAGVDDLRRHDAKHAELDVLDRHQSPKDQNQERLPLPTHPINKPNQVPRVIENLEVECDLASVLGHLRRLPKDVAALITHRVLNGGRDADLTGEIGWSESRLGAAQAAWRYWRPKVQALFAAPEAGYDPVPPDQAWKKWRKWRNFNYGNPRQNG